MIRSTLFILSFLLLCGGKVAAQDLARVNFQLFKCHAQHNDKEFPIQKIKIENDGGELAGEFSTNKKGFGFAKLKEGMYYRAIFVNQLGKTTSQEFYAVSHGLTNELCMDEVYEGTPLWLPQMKTSEKLTLVIRYQGCFGGGVDSIIVQRNKNNKYNLTLHRYGEISSKELNNDQFDKLKDFERTLRDHKNGRGYCTSTSWYKLMYKKEVIKWMDTRCSSALELYPFFKSVFSEEDYGNVKKAPTRAKF